MDPTKLLEADHRQVETLLDQIAEANPNERAMLVDELVTAVRGHMTLEEEVLYPAMEPVVGGETVQEGINEHQMARTVMSEFQALTPDDPGFGGALETLKAAITHHVEDEEGKVFPQLRRDGEQALNQMATPFVHKRAELGLPMDATTLEAAMTKDELLDEAKSAEVRGAASMSKSELAEALAERMKR